MCVLIFFLIWKERTARQRISDTCLVPSHSWSLTWGIYELIIKEHGGEESDVKGAITPRSRSAVVPIIPHSCFSLASSTPL